MRSSSPSAVASASRPSLSRSSHRADLACSVRSSRPRPTSVQDLILIALFATATTYFPTLVQAACVLAASACPRPFPQELTPSLALASARSGLSGWSAKTLTFALWNAYWFWQGCAFVGIWSVIGRDFGLVLASAC